MGEKDGFAKIITDRATEILGAHVIALRATDMIAEICVAMKLEATISNCQIPYTRIRQSVK